MKQHKFGIDLNIFPEVDLVLFTEASDRREALRKLMEVLNPLLDEISEACHRTLGPLTERGADGGQLLVRAAVFVYNPDQTEEPDAWDEDDYDDVVDEDDLGVLS
jgi:hypothetical protein